MFKNVSMGHVVSDYSVDCLSDFGREDISMPVYPYQPGEELSFDKIQDIFRYFKDKIEVDDASYGCDFRSFYIISELFDMGLSPKKASYRGSCNYHFLDVGIKGCASWQYHEAPALVADDARVYVLDVLCDSPLPVDTWRSMTSMVHDYSFAMHDAIRML